jgi:hypothetical protein
MLPTRGLMGNSNRSVMSLRSGLANQAEASARVFALIGNLSDPRCVSALRNVESTLKTGEYFAFHTLRKPDEPNQEKRAILLSTIHEVVDKEKIGVILQANAERLDLLMSQLATEKRLHGKLSVNNDVVLRQRFLIPSEGGVYLCEPYEECTLQSKF